MRQIVLDTETTGLSTNKGHRLTEIGCLEIIDREITHNRFHTYLNPERNLDIKAAKITNLTREFLANKPLFSSIVEDFLAFIKNAELIIHNAPFDLRFLNHELGLIQHTWEKIELHTTVLDTLVLARKLHPGKRNNLDTLCKRYGISNSHRNYHGALLDSEILAKVYFAMTAGQTRLQLGDKRYTGAKKIDVHLLKPVTYQGNLKVIPATEAEVTEHKAYLKILSKEKTTNNI